jgi:hypothetical protein
LPRAALGKGFAEGLRGFAESLGPSAKQPAPVVLGVFFNRISMCFRQKKKKQRSQVLLIDL